MNFLKNMSLVLLLVMGVTVSSICRADDPNRSPFFIGGSALAGAIIGGFYGSWTAKTDQMKSTEEVEENGQTGFVWTKKRMVSIALGAGCGGLGGAAITSLIYFISSFKAAH